MEGRRKEEKEREREMGLGERMRNHLDVNQTLILVLIADNLRKVL